MTKILGLSGSLREQSYNTALLNTARTLAGPDMEIDVATLHEIPLYDGDRERDDGVPEAVTRLKERIKASDGLLIASPEYNNSMPGVLKNAIDWLSRPPHDIAEVFGDRPVAVIGASPGGFGTILAQNAWLPVLRTLGTRQWFGGRLMVSKAGNVFDDDGAMTDDATRTKLKEFLEGFAEFAKPK
ncbi:MAG: NADPH-dependent FMN reductase [Woeseia sp.]